MRTMLAVGLVGALAGCATTAPRGPAAEVGGRDEQRAAVKRAREIIQEGYKALRRGDIDSVHALLGPEVFAVGPAAGDVFTNRTDVVVALSAALAHEKHKVSSRGLHVVSSPGGRAAWAADRLEIDGAAYRMTAILSERDELWVIDAIHLSRPADKVAPSAGAGLPLLVGPGAGDIADLFREATTTPAKLPDQLADSKEALVISAAPLPPTKGAKAIRKLWRKAFDPPPKLELQGGIHAALGVDSTLGFACASVGVAEEPGKQVGQRFFFLYEREKVGWKLIAVHRSVIGDHR